MLRNDLGISMMVYAGWREACDLTPTLKQYRKEVSENALNRV
jgi:hypothetical protein